MEVKAKTLMKDKLWVLERDGQKVGSLQKSEFGDYTVIIQDKKEKFFTPEELAQHYAITFETGLRKAEKEQNVLFNFPTSSIPHNQLYDIRHGVGIFTKDIKSKSFYCAGHFLIRQDKTWESHYCPKLLMVERYDSVGPFMTAQEADAKLAELNGDE